MKRTNAVRYAWLILADCIRPKALVEPDRDGCLSRVTPATSGIANARDGCFPIRFTVVNGTQRAHPEEASELL